MNTNKIRKKNHFKTDQITQRKTRKHPAMGYDEKNPKNTSEANKRFPKKIRDKV